LRIILVAATGWYYSGKALEPVSAIISEVEHIQPSDLSRRLQPGKNQDEIRKLAVTFNHLLERVERAFTMQKMFVSNVSHEMKNPLTVIRSQLDVALQRERSAAEYKSALESVLEDIRQLSETEQRLLHLARVYSSPQSIELSATRLDELIWQAVDQLHKQSPGAKAIVHFSEMPEKGEDLEIAANEPLLRMALVNIMNNACKYSPDNQVMLNASFHADGKHTLEIADNGPGIPDEEKLLVFEPFLP
jgi:signal transduction histidine kinase